LHRNRGGAGACHGSLRRRSPSNQGEFSQASDVPDFIALVIFLGCPPMGYPHEELKVWTILCMTDLPGHGTLSAVEFEDGRFGLYLNRDLRDEGIFPCDELQSCIDTFLAVQWEHRRGEHDPEAASVGQAAVPHM
jgi:hypothetical protein